MQRIQNAILNTSIAVSGHIFVMLFSFITRTVFVNELSTEYLGINGLFSNILNMLSLMELGVGVAINYSLYKPLAENDQSKICSLMMFYRKVYTIIGLLVLLVGVSLTPILGVFIKDSNPRIENLSIYYILYVVNTSLTYLFAYKRSLIIANQQRYIASLFNIASRVLCNITQIIFLMTTHSFFAYLFVQIVFTFTENIFISFKADKLFPYIKYQRTDKLDRESFHEIKKNTLAMIFHKIGSVLVMGTDNLIISKFVGIVATGVYSNYLLISSSLNTFIGLIFQSLTASIGNLGVTESKDRSFFIFKCLNLVTFWIYGFASISLFFIVNPLIQLWLGSDYVFPIGTVLVIVINFYITGMRRSVTTFKDALGLYWQDRYKPIFESFINLFTSILLAQKLGVIGVLIGTAISTLTTCFWIEPLVLFKYGFNQKPVFNYFLSYFKHTILMIIAGIVTWFFCGFFSEFNLFFLIIKILICTLVPNILFLIVFYRLPEFKYLIGVFKRGGRQKTRVNM